MLLLAVGMIWAATGSQAANAVCASVGGFEIDGDMTELTCAAAPGDDWNTSGLSLQQTSQGGTYKTANKDNSDPINWSSTGATPSKTDFQQAYAMSRIAKVGGTDHFFTYVAWERTFTSGTQGYAIEVDNSPARVGADGTPKPDRSKGGTVFYLSANGSNAPTFDGECKFTSQATYKTGCTNQQDMTFAVNENQFTDPIHNTVQDAGSFFEVALDITGLNGIVPSCPGAAATTVYLRSITGQTGNGNLKGYMAPLQVQPDSTCVPPPIVTTASGTGVQQPAGSAQNDTANVGDPNGNFGAPTPAGVGSVKFFLCSPTDVAANGGDCAKGGAQVGSAVTLDSSGQATSTPDVTGATTPDDNANGTYCWRVEFTPKNDTHYTAGSHTNSGSECFTIVNGNPSVSTQIAVTGSDPPNLGFTTLGDTATIDGLVDIPGVVSTDGETVDFNLYGPYADGVTPDCQPAQDVFSTTGTLSSGQASTSTTFTPTAAGTYVWIASYAGGQDQYNQKSATGACSDANESATILAPDVSATKTADAPTVNAGDQIGFTITATNGNTPGTGTAKNVTIFDQLPGGSGVAWTIDSGPNSCGITAPPNQELTCGPDDLAVGASESVHVVSNTDFTSCGLYANTARVDAYSLPQPLLPSDSTTVQCPALTLTKTADDRTVSAGDQIGFTVTAANDNAPGTGTATGVEIHDPLPAGGGVDWSIDFGPNNCSINGAVGAQTLDCTAVDLAPGDSETVHVVSGTNSSSCQAYANEATVPGSSNHPVLTADATTTVLCAHIEIVKTPDAAQVNAGDQIGFTMTVFNTGAGAAQGATLKDTLPTNPGLHWTIASQGGGWTKPCTIAAGVLACGPDTVQAGTTQGNSTFTVHITSTTTKTTGGTCRNGSGVVNNEGDVTTTNDGSDKSPASLCVAAPSLKITKTADHSAPVSAGSSIGFTVEIKNTGPGDATGAVLADALPAGSGSGVTWAIDPAVGTPAQFVLAGAKGAQTLSLASSTLPAGADYKIHITAATSETECSVYDNTAVLTEGNGAKPEPASASESCAFHVDLSITKAGSPATQDLGQGNISWTIVVTNNGPDTDTGVTIADPMPAGNTFVSAATSQGTCTGGAILNCNLGTMAAGASATITLVTKPSTTGAQTNTVTVAGDRPETNTTNNQATATVQVTAPITPPPPPVVYCVAVSKITPHQLFVGRKTMLTIHLTKHGTAAKGVRVLIKGPKLHITTKRSNGRGIVKQIVKMSKAGIDTFIPLANKHCNTKRIGVTGVFTPPVTG